jgi:predicted glycoside hydrolase/deacetylase ChbG (UPF0249 family)
MAFSAADCPTKLREHQGRIIRYLRWNKLAQAVYHPGLVSSFHYVVASQVEEFERTFGSTPRRLDGHHHMHLCANVLFGKLMPAGAMVRRNFSFRHGEKGKINRLYRGTIDRMLASRYKLTDHFFSLPPLEPRSRLDEILAFAQRSIVEVETHPVNPEEYAFLTGKEILQKTAGTQIARGFTHPVEPPSLS